MKAGMQGEKGERKGKRPWAGTERSDYLLRAMCYEVLLAEAPKSNKPKEKDKSKRKKGVFFEKARKDPWRSRPNMNGKKKEESNNNLVGERERDSCGFCGEEGKESKGEGEGSEEKTTAVGRKREFFCAN